VATFIITGVYSVHQHTQALLQVIGVNANLILSQRERVTHPIPIGQSYHDLPENWLRSRYLRESNRSRVFVGYKRVLDH